ncbi:molybdenum cofactor biosynthesis protein MoaE [Spongiivirga citrea]|uniref:Molybdopterin synthase catalytic subunit n=1 Tax=Spongiivirga citrea TaxID=1481457 RepID=A0A6M0CLJ5_9FLAO|nr:molybdenum cofactor biosynthesis protein MoaE [Spongiivirga citrea]NER18751.1 molybdenum cofactor biosynthesis protein MoaE [Spongiivirga citrea]
MKIDIQIVSKIDTTIAYEKLSHPESGGVCVFIGSVRNVTQNEKVEALDFEAYEKMAIKEMETIANDALKKWKLNKVIMHHVVGKKQIEDPVVMVGASSAHRDACFEACRYLIDTLKERVPIWKKEFFENKTVWVSSHP